MPPPFRISSLSVALVAIVAVLSTVYVDLKDTSPGELSAVHAQHPELAGAQNCAACHGQPGQSMAAACLRCHTEIDSQRKTRSGFHGNLAGDSAADCAACHSEHHGSEFVVSNKRSFALAGVTDATRFGHEALDFHLQGIHQSLDCEKCHPNANVRALPIGEKRFLGLTQNCTDCHHDVHAGSYGHDCDSCHGQQHPFPQVAQFIHTEAFALAGSHGKAACVACHRPDSPDAVSLLLTSTSATSIAKTPVRSCRVCHESPHDQDFLAAVSDELKVLTDNSCEHCHPASHETFVGSKTMRDSQLHAHTGFSLDAPHDRVRCVSCHPGFGDPKTQRTPFHRAFPGRHPDDCGACHQDPHQGQFNQGLFRDSDCLACHHQHTFASPSFTIEHHAETRFPLLGKHAEVTCSGCHKLSTGQQFGEGHEGLSLLDDSILSAGDPRTLVRVFHDTPTSCKDCHDDPHGGQFELGPFRGRDCQVCHDEHSFRQPTFRLEQHSHTSFALTGAHAAVACQSCHLLAEEQVHGEQRHGLGREGESGMRVFHGTPTECSDCHADVHDGQFDRPDLPTVVDGQTGCARCHTTDDFHQIRAGKFDHALWTGYALRGAHAKARCTDCHSPINAAQSQRRTLALAVGQQCQSCHSDPHVGQFGPTDKVNCTQCHVVGDSFGQLVFDHRLHSRFQLDRDHERLDCAACHRPQRLADGSTAIRYKPLGTQCGDCHVPSGPRSPSLRGR